MKNMKGMKVDEWTTIRGGGDGVHRLRPGNGTTRARSPAFTRSGFRAARAGRVAPEGAATNEVEIVESRTTRAET